MAFALNAALVDDEIKSGGGGGGKLHSNKKTEQKRAIPREMYAEQAVAPRDIALPKNRSAFSDKESFHNNLGLGSTSAGMADFVPLAPLAPPSSAGAERISVKPKNFNSIDPTFYQSPGATTEGFSSFDPAAAPSFASGAKGGGGAAGVRGDYYNGVGAGGGGDRMDVLITKLNYVINLMEEQQDERTNNVPEEVILYCFLGIFVIFIVDSFVRVGRYVR